MSQIKQLQPKEGVTLLAVKVPEGAYDLTLNYLNTGLLYGDDESEAPFPPLIRLPFKCELLGKTTEIPEEVWQTLLPTFVCVPFRNRYINFLDIEGDLLTSAIKSGTSFLQANEVYSVNPLAFDPTGVTTSDWAHNEANTGTWVILQRI